MAGSVGERLSEAISKSTLKKVEIAKRLNISPQQLNHYLSGFRKPSFDMASKIGLLLGVDAIWLLFGRKESPPIEVKFLPATPTIEKAFKRQPQTYFLLPLVSGEVAAGAPSIVNEEDIIDFVPSIYDVDWCPHPEKTVCVRVHGSSMEPTIPDEGIVAIDLEQRTCNDGDIFALRIGEGVTIKRMIDTHTKNWVGQPDNRDSRELYIFERDELVDAIIGKVVWWWARPKHWRPYAKRLR